MINDKKIAKEMKRLSYFTKQFNEFVDLVGGQCAYTDRIIEKIIEISKEIAKLYQDNFDYLHKKGE